MIDEQSLRDRQQASQRRFFQVLATGASTSQLLEEARGGIQATLAPVRPWYSIFNSVVYLEGAALIDALPRLAQAYEKAGLMAWTVWVPPTDEATGEGLVDRGHVLDSTPMLMAAAITDVDTDRQVELDLHRRPTPSIVAAVNDSAHGILADWSMTTVFEEITEPALRCYAAMMDGEPVSALFALEHECDCYFWFVATAPQARGHGLATELVRHALREAADRGCTTTTLESTAMAESAYGRLGFRPLGRYAMWERRK